MAIFPYVLAGGATLLGMQAGRAAGKSEIEAGKADLEAAMTSGFFRERGIREKRDRTLSSMRARAGASGVAVSGSALEVFQDAAAQAERDLIVTRIAARTDAARARARIAGGAARQQQSFSEGIFTLGSLGFDYAKSVGTGYKAPKASKTSQFGPYASGYKFPGE